MHKVTIKAILLVAGLTACGLATAGGRAIPGPQPPLIVKAAVDAKENVLIITGHNFGVTPPIVTLADHALEVKLSSEHEVVASLPRELTAATYGITVTTSGPNRASSNLFSVALPSAARATMR